MSGYDWLLFALAIAMLLAIAGILVACWLETLDTIRSPRLEKFFLAMCGAFAVAAALLLLAILFKPVFA